MKRNLPFSGLRFLSGSPLLVFGFALVCLRIDCQAADKGLREAEFLTRTRTGFEAIYDLDYEQAAQAFAQVQREYPHHPGPPLYSAVVVWLQELFERRDLDLNRFLAPGYFTKPSRRKMPDQKRELFRDLIRRSRELAKAVMDRRPNDLEARYFLGSVEGILAGFSITIDRSFKQAFSHGKKAYRYHRDIVKEDPEFYDAYVSVGVFEYIIDNLPWYMRWMATILGYRGDKEKGLRYLNEAKEKAQFVADDARIIQMVLFVREKRYQDALANLESLRTRYRRNYILHLNLGQIREKMGHTEEALRIYRKVLALGQEGKPNYHKLPLDRFRFQLGEKLLDLDRRPEALHLFRSCIVSPATPSREKALSYLRAGQIFDLLGKREEALAHYEQVLKLGDVEDSHSYANKWLRHPYSG